MFCITTSEGSLNNCFPDAGMDVVLCNQMLYEIMLCILSKQICSLDLSSTPMLLARYIVLSLKATTEVTRFSFTYARWLQTTR